MVPLDQRKRGSRILVFPTVAQISSRILALPRHSAESITMQVLAETVIVYVSRPRTPILIALIPISTEPLLLLIPKLRSLL
jgi:hypothetical protein